jgi:hypothetical protein
MQTYLLVDEFDGKTALIDSVVADDIDEAKTFFFYEQSWPFGEVISKDDYLKQMRDESELNGFECQSPEC